MRRPGARPDAQLRGGAFGLSASVELSRLRRHRIVALVIPLVQMIVKRLPTLI